MHWQHLWLWNWYPRKWRFNERFTPSGYVIQSIPVRLMQATRWCSYARYGLTWLKLIVPRRNTESESTMRRLDAVQVLFAYWKMIWGAFWDAEKHTNPHHQHLCVYMQHPSCAHAVWAHAFHERRLVLWNHVFPSASIQADVSLWSPTRGLLSCYLVLALYPLVQRHAESWGVQQIPGALPLIHNTQRTMTVAEFILCLN